MSRAKGHKVGEIGPPHPMHTRPRSHAAFNAEIEAEARAQRNGFWMTCFLFMLLAAAVTYVFAP